MNIASGSFSAMFGNFRVAREDLVFFFLAEPCIRVGVSEKKERPYVRMCSHCCSGPENSNRTVGTLIFEK